MGIPVKIENVTICFPHLFEPHAAPGTTNAKYSAEFLLDPQRNAKDLQALHDAFVKAATEAGKGDKLEYLQPPMKDGNAVNAERQRKGKAPRPELEGKVLIRGANGLSAPPVVDRNVQPIGEAQRSMIFGGCVVNAYVDLYWSGNATNPGVFCGLNGVQLIDNINVEKLGGGAPSAEQMFTPVAGAPEPVVPQPPGNPAAPTTPSWL